MSGIVRSDITTSVGRASGVATGVPLDINLRVVDLSEGSAPFAGAAVYVTSLSSDMVLSDGYSLQMADVTESADSRLSATLDVPV